MDVAAPEQPFRALYVHIPFCHSICPFCAFAVHGHRPALMQAYLDGLRTELALYAPALAGQSVPIDSVYFGGGTPSTLAPAHLAALLEHLRTALPLAPDAEVAFEVNPEDLTPATLQGWRAAGVTRFSLGLQSLDAASLRALGRTHTAEQARAAAALLAGTPGLNYNLDLLLGAPGIPEAQAEADLTEILAWRPPHLSLYGLDVEPGTPFGRNAAVRDWSEGHREALAELLLSLTARLRAAGYRHYEVSNLCLPGFEGRQNLRVWDGEAYLGLGTGAHSFRGGVRWFNERHLRAWHRALAQGRRPVAGEERPSPSQRANEALMLALRRDTGLDVAAWQAAWGCAWDAAQRRHVAALIAEGQAREEAGRLILTPPGLLLADEITAHLMVGA